MPRQFKRARAPAPLEIPPPEAQPVQPPPSGFQHGRPPSQPQPVMPFGPGAWFPPPQQSMAASSTPVWLGGLQQPGMASSSGPWWAPPTGIGASASRCTTDLEDSDLQDLEDSDLQAWGVDSHPLGGLLGVLKNTHPVSNGISQQHINVGAEDDDGDCTRTEKRLLWTKEEDLRLVSAWLNNSNDPIGSNYKKNDQYWKGVAAVYNSTTPKNRARLAKHIKDRFGRIKKRVAWFCAAWKEANALWASGESDVDLMNRALATYEEDHKTDGPFTFKHCWDILRKEPKWDAYLLRLDEPESEKRNFSEDEDVEQHFSLDAVEDERPIGGKQAKKQLKKNKKDQACIIDLTNELHKFVDAQKTANEGRKEMLETQRRVSSENLEAQRLAHLAAKENKESVMLETYRSLLTQDTTCMAEDVRSEHVLALRCLREKLFSKND